MMIFSLFLEYCIYCALLIRICTFKASPNIQRLKIGNVGSELCSVSMRDGLVNCAILTIA